MTVFKGFNTVDTNKAPFSLTDIEIVKRDIHNHFMTRKGERVMLPNFGSIIHDYLMNPMDEYTVDIIRRDAVDIISQEPRVSLSNISVTTTDHVIRLEIALNFLPFDITESMYIEFQRNIQESI